MIFYLGEKVKGVVDNKTRLTKNKLRSWEYGYNPDLDIVIISRDGTLGEVFNIQGLKIGLPQQPDSEEIINHGKNTFSQKWKRIDLPTALTDKSIDKKVSEIYSSGIPKDKAEEEVNEYMINLFDEHEDFIATEYKKRHEGIWIYVNGNPVYVPGTYYFGVQWVKETTDFPNFRIIQNELMIFWEACKADSRCYGMQYVKNRRMGATLLGIFEFLESGTITEDKILGMISKKGDDAKKIFRRLVTAFKRLPAFFKPVTDGTNTPKKELVFEEPTKRRGRGDVSTNEGLSTYISWHNTDMNSMDGDAIFRSILDESGKYPPDVKFSEYWSIVKTSHRKGVKITGKSMVVSTVNSLKKGGGEYKKVWDTSDLLDRNPNGQTKSGLYRIFIPAKFCLEGMFDEYGFSIIKDPEKPIKTDEGTIVSIGSESWLRNEEEALKGDPEKYNEQRRQFPDTIKDAFRDASNDCEFNLPKILEQMEHCEFELNDRWTIERDFLGNDDLERGNFTWKDGIKDTEVVWRPDPENGRFFIKKGCHPPIEYRNKHEEKYKNGSLGKAPLAEHIGGFGVDPYNRSINADGRGSKGSIIGTTKTNTADNFPNDLMFLEYIDRPKKVKLFFEDVIMCSVYFSMPFLAEQSNDQFLAYVKDRGYRHYSANNPFKVYNDLTPQEKEFGGAPQQDSKIGEGQFYATEAFVEDQLGVARDASNRAVGKIGDMPFTRTLIQIKDVETSNRTKYDAYIAFSLSRLLNQKRVKKETTKPQPVFIPFQKYDNSGGMSKRL
ncbi:terminase large subunit [Cellulophaga phage phi46:3]|uniref:Uncharacterized protein n=1 Tax=Cellulophaga phage phi46:3 TaxID=1327985 RepID=S0A3N1_9CAUD|nr:terminase large subunit [Cellulophaga phage phi46:3]AGO48838.1 hypothetical protein Phi46:3_gp094 [Cellulophaga phage phi46:3]